MIIILASSAALAFSSKVLYKDFFQKMDPSWKVESGQWSVISGHLVGTNENQDEAVINLTKRLPPEYTIIWRVRVIGGKTAGFRIQRDNANDIQISLYIDESVVKIDKISPEENKDNRSFFAAYRYKGKTHFNGWHTIKIVMKDHLYVVKMDGLEIIRYGIEEAETLKPEEEIGLVSDGSIESDHLVIRGVRQTDYVPWGSQLGNNSRSSGGSCCKK